jgi:cytidine deaminase
MVKKEMIFTVLEYVSENELETSDRELITKAKEASCRSYSPYSHFSVGAAILLDNGMILLGNNQENAAYPSGLCAERVALFYANANYPDSKILTIAIVAQSGEIFTDLPITPCGSCRQVIIETQNRFKHPIKIILYGKSKIQIIEDASTLLPISFGEEYLKK